MYNLKAVKYYEEGRVLQQQGKLSGAERAYKKATKFNRDFVEAHNNLGNVLLDRGRPKEASGSFRKALKIHPGDPMLLTNLGNALQLQGEIEKAINWFNKAIVQDPGFIGAHINLGNASRRLGRFGEAVTAYRHAIAINSGLADTYNNLGSVLIELDELDDAVTNFNKAIEIEPGHIEAYNGLGNAQGYLGQTEQAIAAYRKAIEFNPKHKDAHNGLGNMLSDLGEIDQAIASYHQAIDINPEHTDVYRSLSNIKKFSEYDDDMQAMESLYAAEHLADEQKMHLAFGLGKAYEDLGEYEKSMECILQATRLKRASFNYSISESEALFSNIKATFSVEFFSDRKGMGNPDATPIFILGMPRSGTSLVEQILAKPCAETNPDELASYVDQAKNRSDVDRMIETKEKTGVFTGLYAINPAIDQDDPLWVNQHRIPIWVADYVLMGYGTGAIMAVPSHDQRDLDFSRAFDITTQNVVMPSDDWLRKNVTEAFKSKPIENL
ncbi:MAG: tetratricopeptide repeat protein, partial [Proteobacteria bacterium]|nr:tetratricopeptide repeat protein [Pseudomonadota bacterium]